MNRCEMEFKEAINIGYINGYFPSERLLKYQHKLLKKLICFTSFLKLLLKHLN